VILPELPIRFIPNCMTSHPKNTTSVTFPAVRTSNLSCDFKFELELCNILTVEYLLLSQLLSTDHIILQSDPGGPMFSVGVISPSWLVPILEHQELVFSPLHDSVLPRSHDEGLHASHEKELKAFLKSQ
jgi:hypothetical protein